MYSNVTFEVTEITERRNPTPGLNVNYADSINTKGGRTAELGHLSSRKAKWSSEWLR